MAKQKSKRTLKLRRTPNKSGKSANTSKTTKRPKPKSKNITSLKNLQQYLGVPKTTQENLVRTGQVLTKMESGDSFHKATRAVGINPRTAKKLGGSAFRKAANGKIVINKRAKVLRVVTMPSSSGLRQVAVRGFKTASEIAKYDNAVHLYVNTGDGSKLKRFRRLKLKDASGEPIEFLTDLAELKRQGLAGEFSFESFYGGTV